MISRTYLRNLLLVTLAIALVAGGLVGCKPKTKPVTNGDATSSVTPTATPSEDPTKLPTDDGSATNTTEPTKPQFVRVYLVRGDTIGVSARQIPATKAVASAAIRELLAGPTAEEDSYGLSTTIPEGTELRGVTVNSGTATVDLSGEYDSGGGSLSMTLRLAQVVYTLTQFSTIQRVDFRIEGEPVTVFGGEGIMLEAPQTRGDYEDVTPAILIESPTPGQSVTSPIRATGTGNTFEADFIAEVRDAKGKVITQAFERATSGTGTRGTFDFAIAYTVPTTAMGSLVLYEDSAKDGTPINVVTIPLKLTR
jgi:germination protein M